jgi:hypothetical protein
MTEMLIRYKVRPNIATYERGQVGSNRNQINPKDYIYTGTSPKGLDPHFTVWIQFYWNYRMMD